MQEDIIGIADSNHNLLCNYEYDSWGKLISIKDNNGSIITDTSHIGYINPFRYRSYYYDNETKLYYLNSRYYNPEWGRFINEDDVTGEIGNVLSHNMYLYSFNNPINNNDDEGDWPKWLKNLAIGAAAIAVGTIVTVATGGAALPALAAGVKAAVTVGTITAAVTGTTTLVKSISSGNEASKVVKDTLTATVNGFSEEFKIGGITSSATQIISSGFKLATNLGAAGGKGTGIEISNNLKILSPNKSYHTKDIGGTILNYKNTYRLDVGSSSLLHIHFPGVDHLPFGIISSTIYSVIEQK